MKLLNFQTVQNFDNEYSFNAVCRNVKGDSNSYYIKTKMKLKNIGNGIAQDISFYTLQNGEYCYRSMTNEESKSQKSFCTEEISKNETGKFNMNIIYNLLEHNEENLENGDICLIIW